LTHIRDVAATKKIQSQTPAHLHTLKRGVSNCIIIDDYGALEGCRQAVIDYRTAKGIEAPMHQIDWTGVWWRKPA
jgi:hypothetical protein